MVDRPFDYASAMLRMVFLLALVSVFVPAQAQIYKWVLPDGSILYSDRPQHENDKELELSPLQTYKAQKLPKSSATSKAGQGDENQVEYTDFRVAQPEHDVALRNNAGNVSISLHLEPGLNESHTIDVFMDGRLLGGGRTTGLELQNVDRGSHTIYPVVKDQGGKVLTRTKSITFHLLRL